MLRDCGAVGAEAWRAANLAATRKDMYIAGAVVDHDDAGWAAINVIDGNISYTWMYLVFLCTTQKEYNDKFKTKEEAEAFLSAHWEDWQQNKHEIALLFSI